MGSIKDFKRTTIPFDTPVQISKKSKEVLLNNYGKMRAVLEGGIVAIQMKKLKGDQREVARIDTNVSPPTIEFVIEEDEA